MRLSGADRQNLKAVLLRALNPNQVLILSNVGRFGNITYLLSRLSEKSGIPLSTLKMNAKILRSLGLIDYKIAYAEITPTGLLVLKILNGGRNGEE